MKLFDNGVDQIGVMLGGLARWTDSRLDILAIHSDQENTGQCRWFFKDAKRQFKTICVWAINDQVLQAALERYGFTPQTEIDGKGEVLTGMRWDA